MKKKVLFFSLALLFIDQMIKMVVLKCLYASSVTIIGNFFSLELVFNTGASWGILNDSRWILIIMSLVICAILFKYLLKSKETKLNTVAFTMIFGGLFGNLIDRIFRGVVVDYLAFNFWGYHFPVFNFADIMIVLGTILLAWQIIKGDI